MNILYTRNINEFCKFYTISVVLSNIYICTVNSEMSKLEMKYMNKAHCTFLICSTNLFVFFCFCVHF